MQPLSFNVRMKHLTKLLYAFGVYIIFVKREVADKEITFLFVGDFRNMLS